MDNSKDSLHNNDLSEDDFHDEFREESIPGPKSEDVFACGDNPIALKYTDAVHVKKGVETLSSKDLEDGGGAGDSFNSITQSPFVVNTSTVKPTEYLTRSKSLDLLHCNDKNGCNIDDQEQSQTEKSGGIPIVKNYILLNIEKLHMDCMNGDDIMDSLEDGNMTFSYFDEIQTPPGIFRSEGCFGEKRSNSIQPSQNEKKDEVLKFVNDWSAAVEDEQNTMFSSQNSPIDVEDGDSEMALFSNIENDEAVSVGDMHVDTCENLSVSESVRIRYTRDYLMKFSDCIQAFALPEGLRSFTATGELPLRQLETTVVEEPCRSHLPSTFQGMEHLMFYHDIHYVSNSRRSLVKF